LKKAGGTDLQCRRGAWPCGNSGWRHNLRRKYAGRPVVAVDRDALRGRAFPPRSLCTMPACSAVESLRARGMQRASAWPRALLGRWGKNTRSCRRTDALGEPVYGPRLPAFEGDHARTFGRCGRLGCAARPQRVRYTRARRCAAPCRRRPAPPGPVLCLQDFRTTACLHPPAAGCPRAVTWAAACPARRPSRAPARAAAPRKCTN